MGDGSAVPGQKPNRRFLGWLRYRRSTEEGVPGAFVGEVDPDEPFFKKGAEDTGGVIVTGDQKKDVGIGYFPEVDSEHPPRK